MARKNLDELILKRNQGVNTTTEKVKYADSGVKVVRANNISKGMIDYENCVYVSCYTFNRIKDACKPLKGDVLYTNIGSQLGSASKVDVDCNFVIAWNVLRIQPSDALDSDFLVYLLNNPTNKAYIKSLNSSSTMPFVSGKDIGSLKFKTPSISLQKEISQKLKKLDDKIQLNNETNQTLEQIAQAIFKSWFVDFDPVHAKANALNTLSPEERAGVRGNTLANQAAMCAISGKTAEQLAQFANTHPEDYALLKTTAEAFPSGFDEAGIPEGWEVKPLSETIQVIGGGTPKRSNADYWNGNISWFSVKDVPSAGNVFVIETEEKITELGLAKSSTKLLSSGTTIITARGTVGKLALLAEDMCMNQSCYGLKGKNIPDYFNYFNIKSSIDELKNNTHGAVFDTITTKTFATCNSVCFDSLSADMFENNVMPLMKKIKNSLHENKSLQNLRDTLLPKLLSGDLA